MIELLLELIVTPILQAIGLLINVIFWSLCWIVVGVVRAVRVFLPGGRLS